MQCFETAGGFSYEDSRTMQLAAGSFLITNRTTKGYQLFLNSPLDTYFVDD